MTYFGSIFNFPHSYYFPQLCYFSKVFMWRFLNSYIYTYVGTLIIFFNTPYCQETAPGSKQEISINKR